MKICIVCGGDHFDNLYNGLLKKCTSCGFVTAQYDMQTFDADKIYDETYFNGNEYENYLRDREVFLYNYNKRIQLLRRNDPSREFSKTLELGCAYGFFGLALKENFPKASYTGIDITPSPINYGKEALGLDLICGDYLDFKPQTRYTDIFMWDVIEHLPEPDLFIEKINADLDEGGRLYLTTGDISALLPKIQGRKWRMIHPPSHLHYFSKKTITDLLNKKGFKVISVNYPSVSRSVKQIYYSLFLLNREHRKFHRKVHSMIPENLNVPLNTFDIMLVVAEKRPG